MTTTKKKQNWIIKHLGIKKANALPLLLGVLLIITIFQTVELMVFKSKLEAKTLSPASAAPVAGSIDDLPDMVGGC